MQGVRRVSQEAVAEVDLIRHGKNNYVALVLHPPGGGLRADPAGLEVVCPNEEEPLAHQGAGVDGDYPNPLGNRGINVRTDQHIRTSREPKWLAS